MPNKEAEDPAVHAKEFEDFVKLVKKAKAGHRLHSLVENKLASLLSRLYPKDFAVPEVSGVLGGRNDLMQFSFNGRRAVFELFFSPSQVPQDLRLLEQAKADVKVAILLDKEINATLANEYFHKKPDHFPYLWLSDLMVRSHEEFGVALLRELVDEDASINRLRRILSSSEGHRYEELLYKQLASIEADLNSEKAASEESQEPTGREYIILQIITKIRKMGVPMERLGSLDAWLQKNVGFAFTLVALGLQAFLKTDLDGHYAIWAAGDFADSLIIGGEDDDQVYLVICLNSTINDLLEDMGMERRVLQKHFFHTYEEDETDAELESDTS